MKPEIPSYLADRGITSTSANHLANIAKELIQDKEAELAAIELYSTSVELINGERKLLRRGYSDTARIQPLIEDIALMCSFCAWVREAIKGKEELLLWVENLDVNEYCELKGIEYPTRPTLGDYPTKEDVFNRLDIKSRNEYLTLEAYAATYGKQIHKGGNVAKAREKLMAASKTPASLQGSGSEAIIYTYLPTSSVEQIDKIFFELQNSFRENEARLNALKAEIDDTVKKESLEIQHKFNAESEAYAARVQEIENEFKEYRLTTRAEISKLKIVLPDKLVPLYEMLNSLGKKNNNA